MATILGVRAGVGGVDGVGDGRVNGYFKPKHPEKYDGDPKNIVFRSSWEMKFMLQLDKDPNVVLWQSEEFAIPYTDPTDFSYHRYFPDFFVKKKNGSCYVIEIKPYAQTQVPKRTKGKKHKTFLKEAKTFGKNVGKWESAKRYCDKRGYKFLILTEKELKTF